MTIAYQAAAQTRVTVTVSNGSSTTAQTIPTGTGWILVDNPLPGPVTYRLGGVAADAADPMIPGQTAVFIHVDGATSIRLFGDGVAGDLSYHPVILLKGV